MTLNLLLGVGFGAAVGCLGRCTGFLSLGGVAGVVVACVSAFVFGDWVWAVPLLAFFLTWNLWSRYGARRTRQVSERFDQSSAQNLERILARAGWAVVLVLLHSLGPGGRGTFIAFVGSLATAGADTWATELGVLGVRLPRLITTGRRVRAGTPGAVSMLGLVAALGASWLIGFVALLSVAIETWLDKKVLEHAVLWLPLVAMIGGMAGCLTDSLLGATAQGVYYCERCQRRTESRIHSCGEVAEQIRGWRWLTNEGIDFVSTLVGAAVAAAAATWLVQSIIRW